MGLVVIKESRKMLSYSFRNNGFSRERFLYQEWI